MMQQRQRPTRQQEEEEEEVEEEEEEVQEVSENEAPQAQQPMHTQEEETHNTQHASQRHAVSQKITPEELARTRRKLRQKYRNLMNSTSGKIWYQFMFDSSQLRSSLWWTRNLMVFWMHFMK